MKKLLCAVLSFTLIFLCSCTNDSDLLDMESVVIDEKWTLIWEDRTYTPFCVVSKSDCGKQIGYVNGDKDERVSEYKGYSSNEWLVSWMPTDGGAMLLKEQNVVDIPDGLVAEYD